MRALGRCITIAAGLATVAVLAAGCGAPDAVGNMPGPVQRVVDTGTLSGRNIGINMLTVTGNQSYIGTGRIPGYYNYGPTEQNNNNTYYVNFHVPVDLSGIEHQLGYRPRPVYSSTIPNNVYVNIDPLPDEAFDRLYYNPSTRYAKFSFKLNPDGRVMDESWDGVAVNS